MSSTGSGRFDVSVVAGDLAGNGLIASENPASCQLAVKYDDECLKMSDDGVLSLNVRKLVEDDSRLLATKDCRIGLATQTKEFVTAIKDIKLEAVGSELKVSLDVEYGSFQVFRGQSSREETFTGSVTGETC